jgi:DNA polymerase-3 subunit chi
MARLFLYPLIGDTAAVRSYPRANSTQAFGVTRIDFYILPEGDDVSLVMTTCKLCDKAAQGGAITYVHVPEPAVADALDAALWSFRQGSFIAHERLGGTLEKPLPLVLIGHAEPPADYHGVMINLDTEVPPFFSRFERVLEIVQGDASTRAQSRTRFKFYRDRGYELTTHNL